MTGRMRAPPSSLPWAGHGLQLTQSDTEATQTSHVLQAPVLRTDAAVSALAWEQSQGDTHG